MSPQDTSEIHPSGKLYTPTVLWIYEYWVLSFLNTWILRCPTKTVLLPFYQQNLVSTEHHLDVGVGNGYYPANSVQCKIKSLTLMDINNTTLVVSSKRVKDAGFQGGVESLNHSIFDPLPSELLGKFDSISLFYVFHCLPGAMPSKAKDATIALAKGLTPNGVLYGATILHRVYGKSGKAEIAHNWFGRSLSQRLNRDGVWSNYEDDDLRLRQGLEEVFEEVEIRVVGVIALFECRKPRL